MDALRADRAVALALAIAPATANVYNQHPTDLETSVNAGPDTWANEACPLGEDVGYKNGDTTEWSEDMTTRDVAFDSDQTCSWAIYEAGTAPPDYSHKCMDCTNQNAMTSGCCNKVTRCNWKT